MNGNRQRNIWVNEDDAHFYSNHSAEDMTVEGLERLVDYYAEDTGVAGILFCCAMQKALFASEVWEPLYAGYDPDGGAEQPFLRHLPAASREIVAGDHGRNWVHNLRLLCVERRINHLQVWLDRCRYHGIPGWLTVRMNDCHGLSEWARMEAGEEVQSWCLLCPSEFWKQHPELRRAPHRWERSWEGAFDYGKAAVREHYLALLREVCEKFDFDGLELDWMRWGQCFAPGEEREGRGILTEFVREVRGLTEAAARRLGHPVKLGGRIPAEPRVGWSLGYDGPRWAREGLVDQLVLGSFAGCANFDVPVEEWRLLCGDAVTLLVQAGATHEIHPHFTVPMVKNDELQRGACANALSRGADGVYLFNDCYREWEDSVAFKEVLRTLGDEEDLGRSRRRHLPVSTGMTAPGEPILATLPVPLLNPHIGSDFGRMEQNISVRVFTGPVPSWGTAVLHLGFSREVELEVVRVNGRVVEVADTEERSVPEVDTLGWYETAASFGGWLKYEVPLEVLKGDSELVEFVAPEVEGEVLWVEIQFGGSWKDVVS